MPDFHQYDPLRITVSFKGVNIQGFASGTFVEAERAADGFTMNVGSQGDVVRVQSRDLTGKVTVTLQAASPTNDLLSAIARQDQLFGLGVGEFMVKEVGGTTLVHVEKAWIQKLPNVSYGDEETNREWVFGCAQLEMHVGGSVV